MKPIKGHGRTWASIIGLALLLGLVASSWAPLAASLRQSRGVRSLLQAGASLDQAQLADPFVCLRQGGDPAPDQAALSLLQDAYLGGVGLCLAGERGAGLASLQSAGRSTNAAVQYAAGLSADDLPAALQALERLGLADDDLATLLEKLSAQEGIDPYLVLPELAQVGGGRAATWRAWLKAYDQLIQAGDWQAGRDWLRQGLALAPTGFESSLLLRLGRIDQSLAEPRDPPQALGYIDQALEAGGWLYPADQSYAYLYRGEVYRLLKDQFTPQQALQQFQAALRLQPGSYWALLDIGHLYLYDLKDLAQAEASYRQALASNPNSPYAYYYLGEVCRARGDMVSAAGWYRQALEQQAGYQPALDRLQELSTP
jgi:tetratricopeptide (TPR) repeat protein